MAIERRLRSPPERPALRFLIGSGKKRLGGFPSFWDGHTFCGVEHAPAYGCILSLDQVDLLHHLQDPLLAALGADGASNAVNRMEHQVLLGGEEVEEDLLLIDVG